MALLASTWVVYLAWGVSPMVLRDLWCCFVLALGWTWWLTAPQQLRAGVFANALVLGAVVNAGDGLLEWLLHLQNPRPGVSGYVHGFMHQRNHFASLLMMGWTALALVPPRWTTTRIGSVVDSAIALLLGAGLSLSGSRTGGLMLLAVWLMLEVGTLGGWWPIARAARPQLLARWAMCAYLAITFVPGLLGLSVGFGLSARLSDFGAGCQSRLFLWSNVLHLIGQKPWLGWGWGELDYAHFITQYPGERFCDILDNAHNLPLHLGVELGVPIAVMTCSVAAWLVWRHRPWAEKNPARQFAWGILTVIGFHSLLEYPLWYGPFQLAATISIGILCAKAPVGAGQPVRAPSAASAHPVFAAILIALCGYVAWDYHRISQIYLAPTDRSAAYRSNTLQKIKGSWLFSRQVDFADLTLTPVTALNAVPVNALAHQVLHFSPEARVVEKLIDSAHLLGKTDEVEYFRARFQAAYPDKFERWLQRQ